MKKTNPSNPCGSNFSREHLEGILAVAEKHKILVIADEIYAHIVSLHLGRSSRFTDHHRHQTWNAPFVPLASLSSSVPIITLSGLSKRFVLPGWRFGWAALHDPLEVAGDIKDGLYVWGNRFMGPNSLVQAALPAILDTPAEWFEEVTKKVQVSSPSRDMLSIADLDRPTRRSCTTRSPPSQAYRALSPLERCTCSSRSIPSPSLISRMTSSSQQHYTAKKRYSFYLGCVSKQKGISGWSSLRRRRLCEMWQGG